MNPYTVACVGLANSVEGSLLCGVIEVDTGKVVALHSTDGSAASFEREFVRSSLELLRGPSQALFGQGEGPAVRATFSEVQLTSALTCHFAKALNNGVHALVLVTRKDTNVGLGWAEVKVTAAALDSVAQ